MDKLRRLASLDYLRLLAAFAVVFSHSYALTGLPEMEPTMYFFSRINVASLSVNFFFFLSGFLMFGAQSRSQSRVNFLINRLARIVPGLVVCVFTSVIFGSIFTSHGFLKYITSPQTLAYFKNILFLYQPSLPGLFEKHPYPLVVNGCLWTLFYELVCYCLLYLTHGLSRRTIMKLICAVTTVCIIYFTFFKCNVPSFAANLSRLTLFFANGYIFATEFESKRNFYLYLTILLVVFFILRTMLEPQLGTFFVCLLIFSCLIHFGIRMDPCIKPLPFDLSFGIYIYGFPLQQTLIALNPSVSPILLFFQSICLVVPLGIVSWVQIEKPAMQKIKQLASRGF